MPDSLGPVTIGPREIYDQVVQLRRAAERLADRIDDTAKELVDHENRLRTLEAGDAARAVPDHEVRIRAIERRSWPLPSLAALIAVASLVVTILDKL
jgi:hypothetical protein